MTTLDPDNPATWSISFPEPGPLESDGPWLLWSFYYRAWHRRGPAGGANGYTQRLAEAGVFSRNVADSYNARDGFQRRDVALPLAHAAQAFRRYRKALDDESERISTLLQTIVAASP